MWTTFILGAILTTLLLYLPGIVQLRCLGQRKGLDLAYAPFVSLAEYVLFGLAFGMVGISITWVGVVLPVFLLTAIVAMIAVAFRKKGKQQQSATSLNNEFSFGIEPKNLILYMAVGCLVTLYLFIMPLDGPESYVQEFDNAFHLNVIQAFVESGRFSVLQATTFPTMPLQPGGDIAYYPAAWHVLCAFLADLLSVSAAMSENIVNAVFLAIVYPVSMCAFISKIFEQKPQVVPYGSVCVLAFAAFPWGFMVAGPLYSNMAAFILLPAVICCFICMIEERIRWKRIGLAAVFILGVFCLVATQPNAIFTAIIILTPWCMLRISRFYKAKGNEKKGFMLAAGFLLLVVLAWLGCRHISLFESVVNYFWQPYTSLKQVGFDYVDLGYRNAVTQILLSITVLVGIVFSLVKKQFRWLLVPYVFFGVAYASASASLPFELGSILSGYWYNNVDRIAACAVLVMTPLAALGLFASIQLFVKIAESAWGKLARRMLVLILVVVFCAVVYAPNFVLAGRGDVSTSLGDRYNRLQELATTAQSLDNEERAFIEEIKQVLGDEDYGKIANFPFDGSVYAFSDQGLETLYKHYFPSKVKNNRIIQERLSEYASDKEVRDAVSALGIEYVLLLDSNDSTNPTIYQSFLQNGDWLGITSINDSTPGFETVLSNGDMRLYKLGGEGLE